MINTLYLCALNDRQANNILTEAIRDINQLWSGVCNQLYYLATLRIFYLHRYLWVCMCLCVGAAWTSSLYGCLYCSCRDFLLCNVFMTQFKYLQTILFHKWTLTACSCDLHVFSFQYFFIFSWTFFFFEVRKFEHVSFPQTTW